jgi:CRP/FNR family cyclic AMP-dependent transcriptional regulator
VRINIRKVGAGLTAWAAGDFSDMHKDTEINMQMFAKNAGVTMAFPAGAVIFTEGEVAKNVYVVQSGLIEIVTHDKVVDTCGPNEALGFMPLIDGGVHTASARVRDAAELSVIDERQFRFMVDEVPNFAFYIMKALAHRIRGLRNAL